MKNPNVTFVYNVPFWMENGGACTEHPAIGRYVEELARQASQVVVLAPDRTDLDSITYLVQADNVTVFPLPPYKNIQQFWFWAFKYYFLFFRAAPKWDILTIRMPTHLGFPAFLAAVWNKKPIFLVVVGENLPYSKLLGYPLLKQWIANLDAQFQDVLMDFMVGRCLTFTNGEDLFRKFGKPGRDVHLMRSSTIRSDDIVLPEKDSCQHSPYQVLTVGTIAPRKGTSLIPRVISSLKERGISVEWSYIGAPDGNSGEREMRLTMEEATDLGVLSSLKFLGSMEWDLLNAFYRKSDLFVLPTHMEGVPRVILEAQAAGLPVISTNVGGIPQAVKDGKDGLLVAPGNSEEIVFAIEKIIRNPELRQKLIRNGIDSARKATIDVQTSQMFDVVREYFGRR
jgi:glycosyltransferase involved in cell wall biosynthesis